VRNRGFLFSLFILFVRGASVDSLWEAGLLVSRAVHGLIMLTLIWLVKNMWAVRGDSIRIVGYYRGVYMNGQIPLL